MNIPVVKLNKGRERSVQSYHPWIFSGAVTSEKNFDSGSFVKVISHENQVLGIGYYNTKNSLAIRMLSFQDGDPQEIVRNNIRRAVEARKNLFTNNTNCYRLVNAEGDALPGLVVDKYDQILVVQITTLGMEKIKDFIISELKNLLNPNSIIERSEAQVRKEEGLSLITNIHFGEIPDKVLVTENGMQLYVDLNKGQKTGFFLDQREMRSLIGSLSKEKSVLNCFSYSGGFSVAAALQGAKKVISVDISEDACSLARDNLKKNSFTDDKKYQVVAADVFDYLRKENTNYDVIILDPPAFVKRKDNLKAAMHGYRDINRIALSSLTEGGMLATFSCSYYMTEQDFEDCLMQAARSAKKQVSIISKHRRALDHPTALAHPEGNYLKGLVLRVM